MIIYGIPNCNTVKKAKNWLEENEIDFEFHDFKKKGVTVDKLEAWFQAFGWEKVINKNGLTFKKLSPEERAQVNDSNKALAFLIQNTSAIKRPVIEQNGKVILIGFDETQYAQKLK